MRVWKIGSNWGFGGKSVLPLFLDYGVAFFGGANDGSKKGDHSQVAVGDLLVIADGARPIGLGLVQTPFKPWNDLGVRFREVDIAEFLCDDVVGCRARFQVLQAAERPAWRIHQQSRFCEVLIDAQNIRAYWEALDTHQEFEISSRTVHLHGAKPSDSLLNPWVRYLVPIYQRPYSWGEPELSRLLQEIVRGVQKSEPVFLGTMQVSKPIPIDLQGNRLRYDIIDGQQRISSLYLMTRVLSLMGFPPPNTFPDGSVLRTQVDRGSAQSDWEEFLRADLDAIQMAGSHRNAYLRNATFLYAKLNELCSTSEGEDSTDTITGNALSTYLMDNIRVVVIETHAGLSKTIQIFNTINTTGLDLSGADVFKVRFFEFLKDKQDGHDSVFDSISALYGVIQEKNRAYAQSSVSMPQVLSILQSLIIAYYDLPVVLFDYANDRFFDHLFDSLLGINSWPHFAREKLKILCDDRSPQAPLSIAGIRRLIEARYRFDELFNSPDTNSVSDVMLNKLIWHSRYGWRYWYLPVIHLYLHPEDIDGAKAFFGELTRLTLCYSLKQRKAVYAAHACIRAAVRKLVSSSAEATQHMADERKRWATEVGNVLLKEQIAWNPTWKSITCRLGELFLHDAELDCPNKDLVMRVFHESVDIEHIQSYNDKDGKRREDVWKEWGDGLNGLGNLAMLETSINRSISNGTFAEKKYGYVKSRYATIRQLSTLDRWELQDCRERCERQTETLMAWLFPVC